MFDPSRLPTPDRIDLRQAAHDAATLLRRLWHDEPKTIRPADQEDPDDS